MGNRLALIVALGFSVLCLGLNAQKLSGNYLIGSSANADFKNAKQAIKALYAEGISSSVKFQIEDGVYYGQLFFDGRIDGSSPINRVSFVGNSFDSTGVVIERDTQFTVSVKDCPNLIFKNITFSNYESNGLNVNVQSSDSTQFISCKFSAGEVANRRGLHVTYSNNVLIQKCSFQSSFTGFYSAYTDSLRVIGCHFKNLDRNGIELKRCNNPFIINNLLDSFISTGDADPIDLDECNGGLIDGNRMYSGEYGVVITESNKSFKFKNEIVVQNNEFSNLVGAFRAIDASRISFLHNSIYHLDKSGYAIDISETDSLRFANNNIVLQNVVNGFTIDLVNDSASLLLFDYNNIFFKNVKRPSVFLGEKVSSFTELVNAYAGFNKKSLSIDPYFNNLFDLKTKSPLLNNAGLDVGVATDILGNKRPHPTDKDSVDIGCYEFSLPKKDLDFTEVIAPIVLAVGSNGVTVEFLNSGSQNIINRELVVEYSTDNGNAWVLDTMKIDTLNSGGKQQFTFTKPWVVATKGNYVLKVRIAKGLADEIDQNDEIEKDYCTGISGQYIIGNSASADFSNFNDAIASLACGVSGPVVFNIESGTYNGNVSLGRIEGMSKVNTVSFVGASRATSIIASDWYRTIDFIGASFFEFSKLTIKNTRISSSNAIFLYDGSCNITITNCDISTASNRSAIFEIGDLVLAP